MRSNRRTGSSRHRSGGRVEACQPLWRKVTIPSSKINPYRIVIVLRLVVLCFFFKFRITTPAMDAVPLWLAYVICELWFVLSWILNQLPNWSPVTCETVPGPPSLRAARCPSASSPSRPAPPEFYFSQKIDYLKDKVRPTFVKERRAMKREYEEFKVRIAALVSKAQKKPEEGWVMQDGTPWPENNSKAVHEAMCFLMDPRLGKKLLIHP